MTQEMIKEVDTFFSEKTVHDVDRCSYLICNIHDKPNKITISLVFMRDWDTIESNKYNTLLIDNVGAVLTFPCYWPSIPKELAITYITKIIDKLYAEHINSWIGIDRSQSPSCPCI